MGDFDGGALASPESSVKYHSCCIEVLTSGRYPAQGQCLLDSLTGAVASQIVTEAPKGSLSAVGNRAYECKGIWELNCETDTSSRCESRA